MAAVSISRKSIVAALVSTTVLVAAGGWLWFTRSRPTPLPPIAVVPVMPPLHWTNGDLRTLLAAIDASRSEGLNPIDYRREALSEAVTTNRSDAATDALASDAAHALAGDYADGHIRHRARYDWHIAPHSAALASLDEDVRKAVEGGTLDAYLAGLLPHDGRYLALKDALRDTPADEHERIAHIRASMERWRWMPHVLGEDYVWVNVPTYRLALMHGQTVTASHVVVVGAAKTPTPMLSATIGAIIVNPWWTLPPAVLAEGKRYPPERGYIYAKIGDKLYVRQKPGPDNALGRLKIDMPNPYAIYLHDTPAKWGFAKPERALSHGCIRVQGIASLAEDLATRDAIIGAMADHTTHSFRTPKRIPVYIVYFTAAPNTAGKVVTYADPYARDDELIAALDRQPRETSAESAVSFAPTTKRAWLTASRKSTTNGA